MGLLVADEPGLGVEDSALVVQGDELAETSLLASVGSCEAVLGSFAGTEGGTSLDGMFESADVGLCSEARAS